MRERITLVRGHTQLMIECAVHFAGDVLDQRAAAGDVQDLYAPADGEDRQAFGACAFDERHFEPIAIEVDVDDRGMGRLAVAGGRHVLAPGQEQPVDRGERRADVSAGLEHLHLAADMKHRLTVVFELATRGEADDWHRYILMGTWMPIKSSACSSCRRA